jgi:hypothetical protein
MDHLTIFYSETDLRSKRPGSGSPEPVLLRMKQTPQSFIHYYRPPGPTGAPVSFSQPATKRITTTSDSLKGWALILGAITLFGYGFSSVSNWADNRAKNAEAAREAQVGRELKQEAAHPTPSPLAQWVPGTQYRVSMPDGRTILVNFKGWVDHACNLPRQPAGGANNAMYFDSKTGVGWIWTVPVGASNVPRWIDP